ncbi:MAG TPA: hypothetical protein VG755_38630 [Nannocystaceae bacterium]|nr:hypothetical protein [Nannocystaceae bacterium]
MTTTARPILIAALALTACDFNGNSVGKEISNMQGDTGSETGTESGATGDDGASGNVNPTTTAAMSSSADDDGAMEESETGDDWPPPPPADCDLGGYLESAGLGNYICGYTPFTENLQLTHDCILNWDESGFTALWTRPEQPIAEAVYVDFAPAPTLIEWYQHDSGIVTTWTCSDIVETPDCTVGPTDMCLICVDPGTPMVVCES